MRIIGYLSITLFAAICVPARGAETPATQPSTIASTQPAFSLHGRVTIGGGLDLQKPDLSRAVVYLDSNPALDAKDAKKNTATMSQRNKSFSPSFLIVPRDTDVEFPNWDHFDHNVFSRSKAAPAFDLDRYPYGYAKARTFDKIGVVQVFCNIHPSMRALIFVTPNRYFTRVNADGRFELTGVPTGDYELVVWHERCEEQRRPVHVQKDAADDIVLTLQESRKSILTNDPPRRPEAYGVDRGLGVKRERLDLPVVKDIHPATTQP